MKYLINNADDFGYRLEVSKAIIDANINGVLTSTTVLVNFITDEEVELTKQAPNLGLGLHLNITSGKPLTENWRKKYGEFSRPKRNDPEQFNRELWIPFFDKYDTEDVYLEYKAQLDKFQKLFGKLPTHLDSHHYHSAFPKTFEAFLRIAKETKLPVRNQVLFDFESNQHPMGNIDHMPVYTKILKDNGIKTTDYFSLLYFNRYTNYLQVIENELSKVSDGQTIELSYHPGLEEDWRKKDLEILKNNDYKNVLKELNIKLINFSDL